MADLFDGYEVNSIKSEYSYRHGNSKQILQEYEAEKFDLVITSPPYNVGKEYETKQSIEKYLEEQAKIISSIVKLVSKRGSICWQVGNYVDPKTKEIFPLDIFYYQIFKDFGLKLRNRIVWHFGHGLHASFRFSGRYETILWFTKSDDDYIFNLDPVRQPQKYPGKRHFKGPNKGKYSSNPKGKNPSDVWEITLKDWEKEIWDIPNVKANHKEKTIHPCQYPIELVERCILALTNEDSWILDPFAGVGSTLLAAIRTKRNVVAIEKCKKYIKIGEKRIEQYLQGRLNVREMTQPIFDHRQSKLSQVPDEFKFENKS